MDYQEWLKTERDTALCLSELAAIVADGVSLDSYEACQAAVERIHRNTPGKPAAFDRVWEAIRDLQLIPHFTIPSRGFFNWKADGLLVEMLLCGLMDGSIHWCRKGKRTVDILVEQFTKTAKTLAVANLEAACRPGQFRQIIADLIGITRLSGKNAAAAEDWLFRCLCRYDLHSLGLLQTVCDVLFSKTIEISASREMDQVLSGPNGKAFEDYIYTAYTDSLRHNDLRFGFAVGAVVIHRTLLPAEKPLSLAEQLCLQADTKEAQLPLLSAISLLLWSYLLDGPDPEANYHPSKAFYDLLQSYLLHPAAGYSLASSCAGDLILSGKISSSVINAHIAFSAVIALYHDKLRKWAEQVLCLFEGKVEVDGETRQVYASRFQREITQLPAKADPAVTFGCCYAMQVWDRNAERTNFMELGRYYSRESDRCDQACLSRMQCLLHRVIPDNQWFAFTHSVDHVNDLYPLLEEELVRWEALLSKQSGPLCLKTKKEAVAVIHCLDAILPRVLEEPEAFRSSFSHVSFSLRDPGSYLVTRWFDCLCALDLGEEAVAFYRQHKRILDLPACFYPIHWHGRLADILRFVHFFDHTSRFLDSIRRWVKPGNTEVLKSFLNSEYRSTVDSPLFWDRVLPFADASLLPEWAQRFGRSCEVPEETKRQPPREPSAVAGEPVYTDFYDDNSVILYSLKTRPAIRHYLIRWIRKVNAGLGNELENGGISMNVYDPTKDRIVRNRIRCLNCGDIIESRHYHDFVLCSCGDCAVDGGVEYLRRLSRTRDGFEELSEVVPRET